MTMPCPCPGYQTMAAEAVGLRAQLVALRERMAIPFLAHELGLSHLPYAELVLLLYRAAPDAAVAMWDIEACMPHSALPDENTARVWVHRIRKVCGGHFINLVRGDKREGGGVHQGGYRLSEAGRRRVDEIMKGTIDV